MPAISASGDVKIAPSIAPSFAEKTRYDQPFHFGSSSALPVWKLSPAPNAAARNVKQHQTTTAITNARHSRDVRVDACEYGDWYGLLKKYPPSTDDYLRDRTCIYPA